MKNKLNTLKDIEEAVIKSYPEFFTIIHWIFGKIRQEAIKDIKTLRTSEFINGIGTTPIDIEDYIKWKNNLTDEDLK